MARTVNVAEHTARRDEILDAAQRLILSTGYERLTVQDILDELQISKGAFYHYFDSKPAVLEALIERSMDAWEQALAPIAEDSGTDALSSLQQFFTTLAGAKARDRALLLGTLPVVYSDENALVRTKLRISGTRRFAPILASILVRGAAEGAFTTPNPRRTAAVILSLFQDLIDSLCLALLEHNDVDVSGDALVADLEEIVEAHAYVLERALGVPRGSIRIADRQTLSDWASR